MIVAPGLAWATAAASALLIGLLLARGRLGPRLFVDALAVGVTLGAAVAVALAPFELKTNPLHFSAATIAFLFAGLPEEAVKMLGVAAFLRGHWRARGARDVTLAGGALALGFAALENAFYLANAGAGWATLAAERALTAMPFHVFTGLAAGYVVASVRPGFRGVALALAAWLALAAIHGTYDFAVFAGVAGTQAQALRHWVAAAGWNWAMTMRGLLASAEAAAALAAGLALAALPPPAARRPQRRLARWALSRGLGRALGVALAGAALLAFGGAVFAGLVLESADPPFYVGTYAVLPLALGAMFWAEPAPPRAPWSRRTRRGLAALGGVAALGLCVAAVVWGPTGWRRIEALRFEARGQRLAARGDYSGAVEAFSRALTFAPDRIEALSQRASAYAREKQYDAAGADIDAALRIAPGLVPLYVQRADLDRERNAPAAAIADLDAALQRKPADPELLALRGQSRLEAGDAKGAYDDLAEASRIAPDNALVRRMFATWDVDAGDLDAALRDLNARLHEDPRDAAAAFQRGRVWLYKGEPKRALDDFTRAETGPAGLYPALWAFLARARLGDDGDGALRPRLGAAGAGWPAPVAHMLLGDFDLNGARALASDDGERCEADFYFAASRLKSDPLDASAARLKAAMAECPTGFIEYEGAKAELRRLGE